MLDIRVEFPLIYVCFKPCWRTVRVLVLEPTTTARIITFCLYIPEHCFTISLDKVAGRYCIQERDFEGLRILFHVDNQWQIPTLPNVDYFEGLVCTGHAQRIMNKSAYNLIVNTINDFWSSMFSIHASDRSVTDRYLYSLALWEESNKSKQSQTSYYNYFKIPEKSLTLKEIEEIFPNCE